MHHIPPPHPTSDIPHPTFLPELTDDDKDRIDTWFDHDSRLPEIAKELHTNVLELAAWSNQPHIRQAFAFIKHIAHERTDTLQAEADHQALNRLLSLARFSNHEETARRAAMNVLTWRRPRTRATPKPLPEGGVRVGAIRSPTQATEQADDPQSAISSFQISNLKSPPPIPLPKEQVGTSSLRSTTLAAAPSKPLPEGEVGVGAFRSSAPTGELADHLNSASSPFQISNLKSSSPPVPVPVPRSPSRPELSRTLARPHRVHPPVSADNHPHLPLLAHTLNRSGLPLLAHAISTALFFTFASLADRLDPLNTAAKITVGALILFFFVLSLVFNIISVFDYTNAFPLPRVAQLFLRIASFYPILGLLIAATLRTFATRTLRSAGTTVTFKGISPEEIAALSLNWCDHCGYSLKGIPHSAPCPECGELRELTDAPTT